jgi:excisionase family DNA binding protein
MGNDSFRQYSISKSRQHVERQGDHPVLPTFNDLPFEIYKLTNEVRELKALILTQNKVSAQGDDPLYTVPEAARKLHLKSRSSVYRLIHSQELQSIKISGKRFIKASDIHNFLNLNSNNLNIPK